MTENEKFAMANTILDLCAGKEAVDILDVFVVVTVEVVMNTARNDEEITEILKIQSERVAQALGMARDYPKTKSKH